MSNNSCDIALIHPPDIFRQERYAIFPLSWNLSHVGSTSYVGKYPIGPSGSSMPVGFFTMKNFIEDNSDYIVKIINLTELKSNVPKNIFEKFRHIYKKDISILADLAETMYPSRIVSTLRNLKADLLAVDLHWLIFSQGAIQILKLLKQIHPYSYTLVGGFTASYFKDEIMDLFSFIDFLIVGDGCIPLLKLIKQIKGNKDFSKIPNLLYRERGRVKKGPRHCLNDFRYVQNNAKLFALIPTARGCPFQCITCGGSKYSSQNVCNYTKINVYSIESIMEKLFNLVKEDKGKLRHFLIHDPFLTLGKKDWEILLNEIKRNRLNIRFLIEFFLPHSKEDILNIAKSIPGSSIHISPESMDVQVRSFHKNLRYSNEELIMNMDVISHIDSLSLKVWFMTGLATETKKSIDKTLSFIKVFYKKLRNIENNSIHYNELVSIDPGSLAFNFPNRYNYKLLHKSFLSHMKSFEMPIFKYQINYRTKHYTRDQIFDLFLYMHNEMNKIYYENDIIDKQLYDRAVLYNNLLKKYSSKYDKALLEKDNINRSKNFGKIGNLFRSELEE